MSETIVVPCHACGAELYDRVVWDVAHKHAVCPSCLACVSLDCEQHGPSLRAREEGD